MNSKICTIHGGRALSLCVHPPYPDQVEITWTDTRTYRAIVPIAYLAEAVRAPGAVDDSTPGSAGHELPARLNQLEGDVWKSGDLNGLLCGLESGGLQYVDAITVESVRPAQEGKR